MGVIKKIDVYILFIIKLLNIIIKLLKLKNFSSIKASMLLIDQLLIKI